MPQNEAFGPLHGEQSSEIVMTVDEYECVRLIDLEGCTQEECAAQMAVARSTVQSIYTQARRKVAELLVNGCRLVIAGGDYQLCQQVEGSCQGGCCRRCPRCRLEE